MSDAITQYDWHVYVRADDGPYYRYDILSPTHVPNGILRTNTPPRVGDLIWFHGNGTYRIAEVCFGPASWGSPAWRVGDDPPPCWVDVIVVESFGPFTNERPIESEVEADG